MRERERVNEPIPTNVYGMLPRRLQCSSEALEPNLMVSISFSHPIRLGLCQNFNARYDVETDEPQFMTKGHLYRAVVGDTIILPCKVKNLGSYILLWRRSAAVLTAANLMVSRDARLKMVDGYNLQISDVKISDAGDYVCQIGDQEPRDQIHTLEILVPPSIRSVPDHGLVSARLGNTVTLECKSSGNPVPRVHWFRKVSLN